MGVVLYLPNGAILQGRHGNPNMTKTAQGFGSAFFFVAGVSGMMAEDRQNTTGKREHHSF